MDKGDAGAAGVLLSIAADPDAAHKKDGKVSARVRSVHMLPGHLLEPDLPTWPNDPAVACCCLLLAPSIHLHVPHGCLVVFSRRC